MTSTNGLTASSPSWKVRRDQETRCQIEYVPFDHTNQLFAVDASGSTAGAIIRSELNFVKSLGRPSVDQALSWGGWCGTPSHGFATETWTANKGGTAPSCILTTPLALDAILKSDLWYLLTDGEIWDQDVSRLFSTAADTGVLGVPLVFVVTGFKGKTPAQLNVSVGITFFANANDVLVLFKDVHTGHVYILAGKGCFAALDGRDSQAGPDLTSWNHIKMFESEEDLRRVFWTANLRVPAAATRPSVVAGLVDLGQEWRQARGDVGVDIDVLLGTGGNLSFDDLQALLAEEAFGILSVACKTRGRIGELRALLIAQKVEELNVRLEDIAGAADIVSRLGTLTHSSAERDDLQMRLRQAHAQNRSHYQDALRNLQESSQAQEMRQRNRLVNDALQQLAHLESSTYTADILDRRSNRARRAGMVATGGEVQISSLNLETPIAFRGDCSICCGENEVMSISVKAGADSAANTDNFALDFPLAAGSFDSNLDLISSQYICFQCALALNGETIFREPLAGVIPTLDFTGSNKKYIHEQLFLSLTGGLRTGASGASQLFMAIVAGVLKNKTWAGAGDGMDAEAKQRRNMFDWVLRNMLSNTGCRETFNEQGPWVTFPEALQWAARDFEKNGVDSWAVGYPLSGFMRLLDFGKRTGAFTEDTLHKFRLAKVLHGLVSAYLARLFKNAHTTTEDWKQPLLEIIYASFNTAGIPVDQRGIGSVVNDPAEFFVRLSTFLTTDDDLLASCTIDDQLALMRRAQLLAFWLLYHLPSHTRAKTFFANIRNNQAFSHAVLNISGPAISDAAAVPILTSIFRASDPMDRAFAARHIGVAPFVTPFGNSVLRCCLPACGAWFVARSELPPLDQVWTMRELNFLRGARAEHLVRAFGTDKSFAKHAQTGMPVPTEAPKCPGSAHSNLHISVVKVWSRLEKGDRRQIASGEVDAVDKFAGIVKQEICKSGRGDIYQDGLENKVKRLLPSFFEVLRRDGGGQDVEEYEHDWDENTFESKAKWEMEHYAAEF